MEPLDYILQFMAAGIGTFAFAVVLNAPKKEYILCAVNGAIAWLSYLLMKEMGAGVTMACMVSTFVITLISRVFSAIRKNPSTVFLVTAIFPLVPGAGIYYTVYYLIMEDFSAAGSKAMETFEIAGGIVLGIIFGFLIPQGIFGKLASLSKKEEDGRYQKLDL